MKFLPYLQSVAKFLVALGVACGVIIAVSTDGLIDGNDWLQIAIAFGCAFGVCAVPNKTEG